MLQLIDSKPTQLNFKVLKYHNQLFQVSFLLLVRMVNLQQILFIKSCLKNLPLIKIYKLFLHQLSKYLC